MAQRIGRLSWWMGLIACSACNQGSMHIDASRSLVADVQGADAGNSDARTSVADEQAGAGAQVDDPSDEATLAAEVQSLIAAIQSLPEVNAQSVSQRLAVDLMPMTRLETETRAYEGRLTSGPFEHLELLLPANPAQARIVSLTIRSGVRISTVPFDAVLSSGRARLSVSGPQGGDRNIFKVEESSGAKVYYTFRPSEDADANASLGFLSAVAVWTPEA